MNRSILPTLILLFAAAALNAQDNNRWTFFQTLDWEARLAYLQDQPSAQADSEFLLKVLDLADSERIEAGTETEISLKKDIALRVIRLLADRPAAGAVAAITRIPLQYRDPILRGEAWVALAKLGDQPSVALMVRTLAAINESGLRSRSEEIQASYLVQALGIFKASEAFRTMAAASLAWYSPVSGVKAQAKRTLASLVPDVETEILKLLADDGDLALREGLFSEVLDQGDSVAAARAASALLGTLVGIQTQDKGDQDRIERMTLAALLGAQKASAPPASLVPPLKVLLNRAASQDQMTQTVRLLAKINDPSALTLLSSALSGYNARQKAGTNRNQDLLLVKELFQALGATGKAEARIPLDEARFSGYSAAYVRDVQEALDKLPR